MTAAAASVCLAAGPSRSMRAAMVACSVAGTLTSATSVSAGVAAALADEHAAFGEVTDDLLGEERVAGRALGDHRADLADRRIGAQQLSDQRMRFPNRSAVPGRWSARRRDAPERRDIPGDR